MNARTTTARSRAIAAEGRSIDESQKRAVAARKAQQPERPRNALEAMSRTLNVSAGTLKNTLINTVFKGCRNEEEFVALVIVANTFQLNPLLKEIYAFPAKGGGVVPMVSVDGWIKLMHSHPAFDGIEFEDITDNDGAVYAIEATVYRTDKNRPTKIIEYLDECKRNTDPWNKSPTRMLRHRALIQCVRVAFGFSGIAAPQEDDVLEGVVIVSDEPAPILPSQQTMGEQIGDEIPDHEQADPETGEIIEQDSRGMTEVSEEEARALDAGGEDDHGDYDEGDENASDEEEPAWLAAVRNIRTQISAAKNLKGLDAVENDWLNRIRGGIGDDDTIRSVEKDIAARKRALKAAEPK